MKFILITLVVICGVAVATSAQMSETITLSPGQQITAKKSKQKVKFIGVTEDSRCPTGANCIWAGRVVLKISVTSAKGIKELEIDTSKDPQGEKWDGWAFRLDSLTPHPKVDGELDSKTYQAKITVTRL